MTEDEEEAFFFSQRCMTAEAEVATVSNFTISQSECRS